MRGCNTSALNAGRQRLTKSSTSFNFYFSRVGEVKTCGLVQQLILRMLRNLILSSATLLNGDQPLLKYLRKHRSSGWSRLSDWKSHYKVFLQETFLSGNEPQKPINHKVMLRKSPASINAWPATFKKLIFPRPLIMSKFQLFLI